MTPTIITPEEILKKYWGYDQFRLIQKKIINSALSGKDTFAIMQTGGGKSVCFQIPTMMSKGMAVVICPLIALMKDQVDALRKQGISAAMVNSQMDKRTIQSIFIDCENGRYKFLYVAPERLINTAFLTSILKCKVTYIVIDEGHTISQWGYDFRTSYLSIKNFKNCFPDAPIMVLTATANAYVKDEVIRTLELREGYNLITSTFGRDNLKIQVLPSTDKIEYIYEYLKGRENQTGIIYTNRRKKCEKISEMLNAKGLKADYYHGGLSDTDRSSRQDRWTRGDAKLIVCTNAFGMGIDKEDVRFVIHIDFPESIEGYYQEIGRGGRDGKDADCIFLYSSSDVKDHIRQEINYPDFELTKDLYFQLNAYNPTVKNFVIELDEFAKKMNADQMKIQKAFKILETHSYISMQSGSATRVGIFICKTQAEIKQITKSSLDMTFVMFRLFMLLKGKTKKDKQIEIDLSAWRKECKMEQEKFKATVEKLIELGCIIFTPKNTSYLVGILKRVQPSEFHLKMDEVTLRKEYEQKQHDSIMSYVSNTRNCRVSQILSYFGEHDSADCGKCDVCANKKQNGIPETTT